VEPTVFSDVEDHFKIAKEEIFGPVQSIFKYSTLDEVIKRANATNYGLGAYLYAKDINVITRLSHAIKVTLPCFPCSRLLPYKCRVTISYAHATCFLMSQD